MSTAKTRFSSRAQLQRGDALLSSCSSTPCWRGVGMIAPPQMTVRRQTAAIAYQVDARQGHERRQVLQEFHWRESNARGAIRPRVGEGVDEIAIGSFLEALQRHGPAGRIADELFQLIAPMRRNRRVGVQRKAVHTGTARTG